MPCATAVRVAGGGVGAVAEVERADVLSANELAGGAPDAGAGGGSLLDGAVRRGAIQ